jgi:hypothetical protein
MNELPTRQAEHHPLLIEGRSPALTVVLRSGRRIEIGGAFDSRLLLELLAVLEQV